MSCLVWNFHRTGKKEKMIHQHEELEKRCVYSVDFFSFLFRTILPGGLALFIVLEVSMCFCKIEFLLKFLFLFQFLFVLIADDLFHIFFSVVVLGVLWLC